MGVRGRAYGLPGGYRPTAVAPPILEADIPSTIARDIEVTAAVSDHLFADQPDERRHITVGTLAPDMPAVNDLWLDIS